MAEHTRPRQAAELPPNAPLLVRMRGYNAAVAASLHEYHTLTIYLT